MSLGLAASSINASSHVRLQPGIKQQLYEQDLSASLASWLHGSQAGSHLEQHEHESTHTRKCAFIGKEAI